MAVEYQNMSEVSEQYDVTSITIPAPAGFSAGDLLIALVVKDDEPVITLPVGWTLIQNGDDGFNALYLSVSYRIAEAEDTDWTWEGDSENWYGVILRYTGHDPDTPINISDLTNCKDVVGNTSDTPVCPDVETTVDGCLILRAFGADDDDTPYSSPDAHDERYNGVSAISTSSCGGAGADKQQASQGATGTAEFTMNAAEQWVTVTVAIAPAEVAPPVGRSFGFIIG